MLPCSSLFAVRPRVLTLCAITLAVPLGQACSDDPESREDADAAQATANPDAAVAGRDDASAPADAGMSVDDAASSAAPVPSLLPDTPTDCPQIQDGDVMFGSSKVRVWVGDDGASRLGPLVVYWHGTCSSPLEVLAGIGVAGVERIKEQGGMVAAIASPYRSPNDFCAAANIPGTPACPGSVLGNGVWCREDLDIADRIVACAIAQVGIDTRRIHSVGMSAGGVMSLEYGDGRSGYLASVASYSGGLLPSILSGVTVQDPSNKFPAMIVHGGPSDVVGAANFEQLAAQYQSTLAGRGQFSFICNHAMGHTIPSGIGASALQFFEDHPYGVAPEPYAQMLPSSFPDYCALP